MSVDHLKEKVKEALMKYKGSIRSVGLCTTSQAENKILNYMSFPRFEAGVLYLHLVLATSQDAIDLIREFEDEVDNWFLDVEKKNKNFDSTKIKYHLRNSNFQNIEPNNLAIDALIMRIYSTKLDNTLIIGTGMLAEGLCRRLHSSGYHFFWTSEPNRKSTSKLKMLEQFSSYQLDKNNCKLFSIMVNTVPKSLQIPYQKLLHPKGLFIEASGSSLDYCKTINTEKIRLDISSFQLSFAKMALKYQSEELFGRRKIGSIFVVSGGYIGSKNDLIVDDYRSPRYVIGLADGDGGFSERLNESFASYILSG